MLLSEIDPFAEHHIKELEKVCNALVIVYNNSPENSPLTLELLDEQLDRLNNARRAIYRFQKCMTDETKMKERAEKRVQHCRLLHLD